MVKTDIRKSLYIESTIPSYATARDSTDIIKYNRQIVTRAFWQDERQRFRLYTSQETDYECERGDIEAAAKRVKFLDGIERLTITNDAIKLSADYQSLLNIPQRAVSDCIHLAVCVIHRIDYLLTWNCSHLGIVTYDTVLKYNDKRGLWTPKLVTPENINEVIEQEELK